MSSLKVTPAQLETLAATAHRSCAEVRSTHQRLTGQLSPLFGADWAGTAAMQFTALYENFDQHARGLCDALDGIAGLLARAGVTYADVEQQIASSFR
jgi:WXG100 family type VII secretion target